MTRNIDELSNLTTQKAEPPKEYFGKMDLNEEQVEKRLQYTKKANELFDVILILLLTMNERGETNFFYAKSLLESWILSLAAEFTTPDDYLMDYATDTAYNFVDTTNKHIDEPWYTSSDRALYNAENGANDVLNYTEYKEAIEEGKTHKKWITEHDNKVRETHREVHNLVIPIEEYFRVGSAQMRFPKDYEKAIAFPEELVNCRCSIVYFMDSDEALHREKGSRKVPKRYISDEKFDEITRPAIEKGAIIERGTDEANAYLDWNKSDATTIDNVMFFRKDVTLSEAYEETYHALQNINGVNANKDVRLRRTLNEIDVKKYLLKNAKKYGIPKRETLETRKQLKQYEDDLARLLNGKGNR